MDITIREAITAALVDNREIDPENVVYVMRDAIARASASEITGDRGIDNLIPEIDASAIAETLVTRALNS